MFMQAPSFFHSGQNSIATTSLVFTLQQTVNPFELQPSNLVFLNEPFTSDTGQLNRYTEGTQGTITIASGQATISHSGSQNDVVTEGSDLTMPQCFVSMHIDQNGNAASGYDNGGIGIAKDANNFVYASWDRLAGIVRVQSKIAGSNSFFNSSAQSFTGTYSMGMSMVGNSITVWMDTGSGWVKKAHYDHTSRYDFRTSGNLTGWKPSFTFASGSSTTWKISAFKAGRFGCVNMRDQTMVTNEDGTPYIVGGLAYFTATAPDDVGSSYCGVFTLNLSTWAIAQTGVIMIDRSSKIYPDLAAQIIVYGNGDRRLVISTWGNGFGGTLQVLHKLITTGDILSGSNVVSSMTALSLPLGGSGVGCYDPMLAYDAANSRWLMAYTITNDTNFVGNPFYGALAYSTDLSTWTLISADSAHNGYEGSKLLNIDGIYYMMVGGPAGSGNSSRVYDAAMSYLGTLNATFSGGADTQPHPMVFPSGSLQYLLTFDNTRYDTAFSWGRVKIHTAPRYA